MAEIKNDEEEHALPSKRKPVDNNSPAEDLDDDLTKKQKLASSHAKFSAAEEKTSDDRDDDDEEEDYEGEDDADSDDEDSDDDEDEESNGEVEIDRKGKGIMKDVKGKGKLIEESDDSSNVDSESDGVSDLSDDPLAEVDLDNILPSRTRRRVVRPGLNISSDGAKDNHGDSDA